MLQEPFNSVCRFGYRQERARIRASTVTCMRYTHVHCMYLTGLPGCARAPMVRIPKVKDSLSNRSGRRRRLLSFRHVPLLLSAYRVFPRSRPSERQRKVLMTWRIIPSIPLYNMFDRRATTKVQYRTFDTKGRRGRYIGVRGTSLYRIIDIYRTRVQSHIPEQFITTIIIICRESLIKFS